ncbi:Uma2 family endonuclease [Tautonia sp. JC769]|uniref:Uma2 family endonuclease n=1 Tax=Tautonia sp. JC769 TaxID=3232135 RepID=UPI003459448D
METTPALLESPSSCEQWAVLPGITWETYGAILEELEGRRVFLTYDNGLLEIMSPSFRHESYAVLIGQMIDLLTMELGLPIRSGRSTTFRRRDLHRGLEPDNCYWIENEPRVRGRLTFDPEVDPPPDLAIEIEVSRRALDRLSIYAALGVPEIWRCDGQRLIMCRRQEDGSYGVLPRSPALPMLPPEQVLHFLHRFETMDETAWKRAFRDWVRAEVLPRPGNPPD